MGFLGLSGCRSGGLDGGSLDAVARARLDVAEIYRLEGEGRERDDALHRQLGEVYAGEALTRAYVDHHHALTRFAEEEVRVQVEESTIEELVSDGPDGLRLSFSTTAVIRSVVSPSHPAFSIPPDSSACKEH